MANSIIEVLHVMTTQENAQGGQDAPGQNKEFEIIVNGRQVTVSDKDLTFEEVLALAFDPVPSGPNFVFTVTFRRGHGNKPEGTLRVGETVKVKEGMIFDVTATDKS